MIRLESIALMIDVDKLLDQPVAGMAHRSEEAEASCIRRKTLEECALAVLRDDHGKYVHFSGHPTLKVGNKDGKLSNGFVLHISPVIATVSPSVAMAGSAAVSETHFLTA